MDESAILTIGRSTWPRVQLASTAFRRYLSERASDGATEEALLKHAADLYLACACALADSQGIAAFDRHFTPEIASFVRAVDPSSAFAEEIKQLVRTKLFVPSDERPPKICEYSGKGPLGGWLRIVSVRLARDVKKRQRHHLPIEGEGAPRLRARTLDPELAYLKSRYAKEFREAFQRTLSELSSKEQNVLCLHYLEGMTTDAIGILYKVSGAAVRQWIKKYRERILKDTRDLLGQRLGANASELDSLTQLVQSQLDLSLSRFLRKSAQP